MLIHTYNTHAAGAQAHTHTQPHTQPHTQTHIRDHGPGQT
jgi:hypothetical protein